MTEYDNISYDNWYSTLTLKEKLAIFWHDQVEYIFKPYYHLLCQRGKHCEHFEYDFPMSRLFYTFKAFICLVMNLNSEHYTDILDLAVWDIQPCGGEYSGTEWRAIRVGHGIFNNWHASTYWDSSV